MPGTLTRNGRVSFRTPPSVARGLPPPLALKLSFLGLAGLAIAGIAVAIAPCAVAEQLGGARARVPAGAWDVQSSDQRGSSLSEETDAQLSFELALDELRQGRQAAGLRRLEGLIARFPDSAFADAARAKVVELYTAPVVDSRRSSLGAAPPPSAAPAGGNWQTEIRRGISLAEDFRAKVGDRVFFAASSAELGGRARDALKAQAEWLKRRPTIGVTIEGHADDPGSAADNRSLAGLRADAVRRRLVEEGVAPQRIRVVAYGADRRVALCAETVCSAQNRRAVSLLDEGGSVQQAVAGTPGIGSLGGTGGSSADKPVTDPRGNTSGRGGQLR